jgi:DNA-binding NtrC family response regulator
MHRPSRPVVFIEDDQDSREIIELAVSLEGYTVKLAKDYQEALDLLTHSVPSIVFVDYYGVASDMKGFIAQIRNLHPHVPIVLMTGARFPEEKTRELGLREYLGKPFQMDDLAAILKRHRICPAEAPVSRRIQRFSLF